MPTEQPVNQSVQNATKTTLGQTSQCGTSSPWKLMKSTDEPAVDGAVHWHFETGTGGCRGSVSVTSPGNTVNVTELITCTHVYVKGTTTTIAGTRVD